jgi:hypothetical protein
LQSTPPPLLVPELLLAEVALLVRARVHPPAEATVARSVANGEIRPVATEPSDWVRVAEHFSVVRPKHVDAFELVPT